MTRSHLILLWGMLPGIAACTAAQQGPGPLEHPCGGNLVGLWNFTSAGLRDLRNPLAATCPSTTFRMATTVIGTMEFRPDGTFFRDLNLSATETFSVLQGCLEGLDCAGLQEQLVQGGGTASCMEAGSGTRSSCDCNFTVGHIDQGSGTYQLAGAEVTLISASSGRAEVNAYCVEGPQLTLQRTHELGTETLVGIRQL